MAALKVGLLGCGMIAELGHLPALRNCPGLVLDAVYDLNWNRALAMQAKFHVPHAYPKESDFWESDLDAVVAGMYAEFSHAIHTGQPRNMPTARDGLIATRIARQATEEAIRDRERPSLAHRSTLARAEQTCGAVTPSPLDAEDIDETTFELTQVLEATES